MNNRLKVFDLIKDLDCEFTFTTAEMFKFRNSKIYTFMLGRKLCGSFGPYYDANWKNSNTFNKGKKSLEYHLGKTEAAKRALGKKDWRLSFKNNFTTVGLEYHETKFRRSKALLPGNKLIQTKIPFSFKGSKYRPKPGFNPLHSARKCPFYYTYLGETYFFGWSKASHFIDVTAVLQGRVDWPAKLNILIYNPDLDITALGSYPFLAYCFKKGITLVTQRSYVNYVSKLYSM